MNRFKRYTIGASFLALSSMSLAAPGLNVNSQAIGSEGQDFLHTLSGRVQTMRHAVDLRRNMHDYFDVLNLLVYLNQSSQMEKKMDSLIGELRRNNQILEKILAKTEAPKS